MSVGDVIYIEANSGAVKRVGRSDAFASEFDLEAEEYVPLPKGDVHKRKEIVQVGGRAGRQGVRVGGGCRAPTEGLPGRELAGDRRHVPLACLSAMHQSHWVVLTSSPTTERIDATRCSEGVRSVDALQGPWAPELLSECVARTLNVRSLQLQPLCVAGRHPRRRALRFSFPPSTPLHVISHTCLSIAIPCRT